MMEKTRLIKLLHILVATIENLDQDQIDQLLVSKAKLAFVVTEKAAQAGNTQLPDQTTTLKELEDCKDRDEARRILSAITSRDALATFARTLKVHVVKHDRREDVESKIIEFVIGGKLRTEALRSVSLKGGGRPTKEQEIP